MVDYFWIFDIKLIFVTFPGFGGGDLGGGGGNFGGGGGNFGGGGNKYKLREALLFVVALFKLKTFILLQEWIVLIFHSENVEE